MSKKTLTILVILGLAVATAVFLLPKYFGDEQKPGHKDTQSSTNTDSARNIAVEYYTCPMHPSIKKSTPGACPVCGMTLVKKTVEKGESTAGPIGSRRVNLSSSKEVLANISTSRVEKMKLTKTIKAAGTIGYAEPNLKHISIRFPGRIELLYVTFTGQNVRRGDPVANVYSPEALSAQREYLMARASFEEVKDQSELISGSAQSLLAESKNKLLLWGFTEGQLAQLESTKVAKDIVTIFSPVEGVVQKKYINQQQYVNAGENLFDIAELSLVWLDVDVYEFEMQGISVGQRVRAKSEAFPGESFNGTITFVGSSIEPSTRTVKIRAELPNHDRKLKPEMFVSAEIQAQLPMGIVVPSSAVVSTGSTTLVWLKIRENVFEPREVTIGNKAEQFFQILGGIEEGDVVVTSGAYLLDSESQMQSISGGEPAEPSPKPREHKDE